jgi:hypothetical protein
LRARLLIFSVIASVLISAFYLSMNASNIYILHSDGMRQRTPGHPDAEEPESLNSFFRADFLKSDEALALWAVQPVALCELQDQRF